MSYGCQNGSVRIFYPSSGTIKTLGMHNAKVTDVKIRTFIEDSEKEIEISPIVVSAAEDGSVKIWYEGGRTFDCNGHRFKVITHTHSLCLSHVHTHTHNYTLTLTHFHSLSRISLSANLFVTACSSQALTYSSKASGFVSFDTSFCLALLECEMIKGGLLAIYIFSLISHSYFSK